MWQKSILYYQVLVGIKLAAFRNQKFAKTFQVSTLVALRKQKFVKTFQVSSTFQTVQNHIQSVLLQIKTNTY